MSVICLHTTFDILSSLRPGTKVALIFNMNVLLLPKVDIKREINIELMIGQQSYICEFIFK